MYRVTLIDKGPNPVLFVKALRIALPLRLVAAKQVSDFAELPFVLLDGVDHPTAELVRVALGQAQAQVRIEESSTPSSMIFFRPEYARRERHDRYVGYAKARRWGLLFIVVSWIIYLIVELRR